MDDNLHFLKNDFPDFGEVQLGRQPNQLEFDRSRVFFQNPDNMRIRNEPIYVSDDNSSGTNDAEDKQQNIPLMDQIPDHHNPPIPPNLPINNLGMRQVHERPLFNLHAFDDNLHQLFQSADVFKKQPLNNKQFHNHNNPAEIQRRDIPNFDIIDPDLQFFRPFQPLFQDFNNNNNNNNNLNRHIDNNNRHHNNFNFRLAAHANFRAEPNNFLPHRAPEFNHLIDMHAIRLLHNNPLRNDPQKKQPPLETIKIKLRNIDIQIIKVPKELLEPVSKAFKIIPNFQPDKASTYLTTVIRYGKIPEDIMDRIALSSTDSKIMKSSTYCSDSKRILQNFFPFYIQKNINEAFIKAKSFFPEAFSFLADNKFNFKKMQKMRTPSQQINISDPLVSLFLNDLYEKEQKELKKKEAKQKELMEYQEAEKSGSLIECECCFNECPFEWMVQCPEGHLFCKQCVERQIETAISEGRSDVPCLKFGGCNSVIPISELERTIPEKTIERLIQTETLNAITQAEIENKVKCHKCGYIILYEGEGPMNCPQCHSQTCPKCGEAWHPKITCEQMKEIDKERLVEEKMNEAVVRTCPKCKAQFMKEEGCNKMECPRCHTWICYFCRKIIPKDVGYNHFWRECGPCPPDRCPLWLNSSDLHVLEAIKAKNEAESDIENKFQE